MWSDRNGLVSPSISLESSRASEEAPWQGAAKQKQRKMLGWEQPEAKCGARQPSGLLENQGKLPFSGGNQQEYEKSTAVLL